MSTEHHGEALGGPCTPEDRQIVTDYMMGSIVRRYLKSKGLIAVPEIGDNREEFVNTANHYDEEAYFDNVLSPLVSQIEDLCDQRGLPFIFAVQFGLDDDGSRTSTSAHVGHSDQKMAGSYMKQLSQMIIYLIEREKNLTDD